MHPIADKAADLAFGDAFTKDIRDGLVGSERQFAAWGPKLQAAEKALTKIMREQQQIDLDQNVAMDELTGLELTKKLGEIEASRAVLKRRVEESEVGLAMLKESVKKARGDLLETFRIALRSATENSRAAIKREMPRTAAVEEHFDLDVFTEWLCYRAALDLLDSEHTCKTYALACAGQAVREATDAVERELAREEEAERQARIERERTSSASGYRPLHALSENQ
jgi:hypothetical protein